MATEEIGYAVVTENGWSYIVGPDGYRDGPIRYLSEAREWADEINRKASEQSANKGAVE